LTVLAVNWTGILAVIALVVAVVAIVIAGLCVYSLVQVRRQTKAAQQVKVTDDANSDIR
jgi:heme/copper-type cytochrome/quinol oxidase subunit 2